MCCAGKLYCWVCAGLAQGSLARLQDHQSRLLCCVADRAKLPQVVRMDIEMGGG